MSAAQSTTTGEPLTRNPHLLKWVEETARLTKLQNEVRVSLSGRAHIARSQSYYLDFTHPLANKGHAVLEIAARLGVSLEDDSNVTGRMVSIYAGLGFLCILAIVGAYWVRARRR